MALAILDKMQKVDVEKAVSFIESCQNVDGSYGRVPGAESHAGQVYTCVGTLALTQKLDRSRIDRLAAWLSERQLPNGGLNGRPEKLEDVCYSWWVLSSLAMIKKLHWIDKTKLIRFILSCQVSLFICSSQANATSRIRSMEAYLIDLAIWLMSSIQSLALLGSAFLAILGFKRSIQSCECYMELVLSTMLMCCSCMPEDVVAKLPFWQRQSPVI